MVIAAFDSIHESRHWHQYRLILSWKALHTLKVLTLTAFSAPYADRSRSD